MISIRSAQLNRRPGPPARSRSPGTASPLHHAPTSASYRQPVATNPSRPSTTRPDLQPQSSTAPRRKSDQTTHGVQPAETLSQTSRQPPSSAIVVMTV